LKMTHIMNGVVKAVNFSLACTLNLRKFVA
jgi:hypothetical protein